MQLKFPFLVFFSLHLLFLPAHSMDLDIGTGMSGVTGGNGRVVPGIYGALVMDSITVTAFSTGVSSYYYYHSAYYLGLLFNWKPEGKFLWGEIITGFGVGTQYSHRGFRDGDSTSQADDYSLGPAFRTTWQALGPMFIGLDALLGLPITNGVIGPAFAFNFQDFVILSIGAKL